MEYVIGVLLLVSFFGLAVYAVRGGNLMIGMLIMGTLWLILPLIGNTFATNPEFIAAYPDVTDISFVDAMTKVYQSGPEGWGNVLVNVVFGAWFGRVLLATGIADALIRKTVELGGDKPVVICVLLLGNVIPNSTLVISIAFALLAPLGLFRGPFTLFGCGAATLGILKGIGFSTPYLFALMVIPSITMNVSICMTQSWIAWGVSYAKVSTREHMKKTLPYAWLTCAVMQVVTLVMFG